LSAHLAQATHIAWTTGGALLPDAEFDAFVQRGRALLATEHQGEPHAPV
jgi:D-serine dehydratase